MAGTLASRKRPSAMSSASVGDWWQNSRARCMPMGLLLSLLLLLLLLAPCKRSAPRSDTPLIQA